MNNKVGVVFYENVESSQLQRIVKELCIFRYFVTEKLIVQLEFTNHSDSLSIAANIYISTYSETDPPIFILLPQLLNTSYVPNPSDYIFTPSFITTQMQLLTPNQTQHPYTHYPLPTQKYSRAVMGGTFDHIHPGHFWFLTIAASVTDFLAIGVTSSSLLTQKAGKEYIQTFKTRSETLRDFLSTIKKSLVLDIFEIFDPISKAGYEEYDAIILTTEVEKAFEAVNELRVKNNLKKVEKFVVNLAEIENGKISSTDCRRVLEVKSKKHFVEVKGLWGNLCGRLGVSLDSAEKWWEFISMQYSRGPRYYHTLNHIQNLYNNLQGENNLLELCIFFHDLIYIPMKIPEFPTNEEQSANYFQEFVNETGLTAYQEVYQIILATIKHMPLTGSQNELEFLDLDLSILVSDEAEYVEYAANVRREYSWYSEEEFSKGRKAVMEGFLKRESLFFTPRFKQIENKARENILNEISTKLQEKPNI